MKKTAEAIGIFRLHPPPLLSNARKVMEKLRDSVSGIEYRPYRYRCKGCGYSWNTSGHESDFTKTTCSLCYQGNVHMTHCEIVFDTRKGPA
ncbi:MAG TPA: hypothetical protein VF077_00435 [Nitrospiraceae bacterium]